MSCPGCGRVNRAGARFCGGCGRPLAPRCPTCGAESEAGARFCDACGVSFAARPDDEAGARKVVTIVFADLAGSTALHERLDAEATRQFMDRYYGAMRSAVEAHGGSVTQLLGDGVKAVFGAPSVAEDDAIRAVRAAVDMQRAFRELASEQSGAVGPIGLRVAVNTGEVVAKDETEIIGDPVNVAARLQQEAHDGDVLIGESTQRLVSGLVTLAPFGTFTLKGRAEPVSAYRVVSLERPAGAPAIAFVGREDELRRLMAVYDAAVAKPGARLAVILGSPGLGKSRLLAELGRRLGDRATVLFARCDAAGGATFAPIAEALRALLGVEVGAGRDAVRAAIDAAVPGDAAERARIADGVAALLAGAPESPEETFFVVRRLLAALAAARPVVLAIDDLQWAEPLLLDLTEHLVQWSSDAPLLVLAAARPELREARSSLAAPGGLVAEVVMLTGLDAGAATRLAANVIGADELPAAIAGRVLATSEGNPLFVGELVRMLVHDGALKREGDRWTAGVELAALEMPPTIHALLAARIERLRPEERTLLERAAVIGRHFSRAAVAQLLPPELRTDLDARLESLRRSELIEPDTGWLLGEPMLRFHHVLIRDAAYRRLLKNTRAELHGRFADWLEAQVGEAVEHDETIGWHLEQAHQHLSELGPIDERGRAVGERAARHLAAAGRRALARDDLPLAASLLGRALDRLDPADPARADLALDWCEALLAAGEVGPAAGAIDELGRFSGGSDRLRAWHTCFAGQLAALTDPQALRATSDVVAAAAEALASAGDAAGEAKAHSVHALALVRLGKVGACEAALDRALAAARRARDRRRANAVLAGAPLAALWGPSPVTRASGRCLDVVRVLRITQGAPAVEAVALRCQAVLEALRGRTEAARRMIASSRRMVEELGITQQLLEADVFAGLIELLEGDAPAAERCLRGAYDGLREHGLGIDAARAAALLGRALLAQGSAAEAEAVSHESEALAGDDLKAAIAWRGVRAEALASRGEHAAAVDFARAAVDLAAATDALLDHADARLALAAALRAAGRGGEAAAEEARAIELWEAKGATLLAERARRDVGRVDHTDRARDDRGEPPRPVHRSVRPNAATAHSARYEAAVAARDVDASLSLFADDVECVNHPTGLTYDRRGALITWRALLRAPDLTFAQEPLATLGDSLALCRLSWAASAAPGRRFDVGGYENERILLIEVDAQGRRLREEGFAQDRLGDAVVRLYERYAELLPEGPARVRAAATARSVAAVLGPPDIDRFSAALEPPVEFVDHRTLGFGARRGAEALLKARRVLLETSDDVANRVDDVLGARSDAILVRLTTSGTDRVGGGAYEKQLLVLWVFGSEGLVARLESFDADRDAEALARFDELTTEPSATRRVRRRVRPNAATANTTRLDAAFAARDADALPNLFADDAEMVHHPTGAVYDRRSALDGWRAFLEARDGTFAHEPVATLGESLALYRQWASFAGAVRYGLTFGAAAKEEIVLLEVDARGRRQRVEFFAADRLSDAIPRLYERYAELLPDGPERACAAATARSVAALLGPFDLDRYATGIEPAVEFVDHRTVGFPSGRGVEELLRSIGTLLETADDVATRVDDVIGLRSDALLMRWTTSGTERVSRGAFEWQFLRLCVFGADGLLTRAEQFDVDRDDDALARFDELAVGAVRSAAAPSRPAERRERRVRANAATANVARFDAAVAARDVEALSALLADGARTVHHATGATYDTRRLRAGWRALFRAKDPRLAHEPLATLGDSLALCRSSLSFEALADDDFPPFGAVERDQIVLVEVDARGLRRGSEAFAADRLGDAVARLYERYAELLPEGPERTRAAATARSVTALLGPVELERHGTAFAPAIECVDHRTVGTWTARGAESLLHNFRAFFELTDGVTARVDDVIALRSDAVLMRRTWSGTDRTGGGAFERPFLQLWVFGADGLLTRFEWFDVDRDSEALARFDELAAEPPAARFANAAIRSVEAYVRSWHARDWQGVVDTFAPTIRSIDRRSLTGLDLQGSEVFAGIRVIFDMIVSRIHNELLATRGERLALFRFRWEAEDATTGPAEVEYVGLVEVDASGRDVLNVLFDLDDLDAAHAELDARFASGEGAPHAELLANLRAYYQAVGARDADTIRRILPDDLTWFSHRRLVSTEVPVGRDEFLGSFGRLSEFGELLTRARVDHVPRLSATAGVLVLTTYGTFDGGEFERPLVVVYTHDGSRPRSLEEFDLEQLDAAFARYEKLTEELRTTRLANAATRHMERHERLWRESDWGGVLASLAPMHCMDDRRALTRLRLEAEQYFANLRLIFENASLEWRSEVLATRGERLALFEVGVEGDVDGARIEFAYLQLSEVDADGRRTAQVLFDPDSVDAAWAELDARYAAGEAAAHGRVSATMHAFRSAFAGRDWGALAARFAADLVVNDHRRLGWETLRGRAAYVQAMRSLVDLAPDTRLHLDHVRMSGRGLFWVARWLGTREGGPFEAPWISVSEHDALGRVRRFDQYDLDQLDAALARYEELATAPPTPRIENAATRARDRIPDAWNARDWERFAALFPAGFRNIDRRRMVQLELDRDQYLASYRPMFEMAASAPSAELLATRGDRLALFRAHWEGADHPVGPSEFGFLGVFEVDERGDLVTIVMFDSDDLDAAYAELDDRYGAPVMPALARDAHAGDWNAVAARLAPDLVVEDHQRLGWETQHGPAAYIRSIQGLAELAPDARWRADHAEESDRGALGIGAVVGSREGGAFEMPRVVVAEFDAQRRVRRFELHDLDQLDVARARFEAIQGAGARDPLAALARPNAATAAMGRVHAADEARDWARVRALCAPDAKIEDRRRHALLSGNTEWWIADMQRIAEAVPDARYEQHLVGTAGDRVDVERLLWTGAPDGGRFEIEYLWLTEVDETGRIVSAAAFDLDDRRAASREARARWLARDAAAARVAGPHFESLEASSSHDRSRVRTAFTDDCVFDDRRRAGVGLVEGADAYLEALAVLWDLAPDIEYEGFVLALERHGLVVAARSSGTLREGGGVFERLLVSVSTVAYGRLTRLELFDVDAADAALARLAELRPDPLRIPPNAATHTIDRWREAFGARDWKALEALCVPTCVFDDRQRASLTTGGRDMLIANLRLVASSGTRVSRTLLATSGDRLVLERLRFIGADEASTFEIENLALTEVDAEGRVVAAIVFDPDDRRAASAELFERHARSDAARWTPAAAFEFFRALNDHDLERCRALLPDDFVFHDHRRTGVGRLESADDYVASLTPLFERAPGWTNEALYNVAEEKHATLTVARQFGTLAEGGECETVVIRLGLYRGDRLGGIEVFEPEDLDVARARFEELRPDPLRIPPNAAVHARDRTHEAWVAHDWAALRSLVSDDFTFEDRGKRALVGGDVDVWIESQQFVRAESGARVARELIGTVGERIALERILWSGGSAESPVEREHLRLSEVDAVGRLRASIRFDLDDRDAAFAEAQARFVAGEAAARGGQAPLVALSLAMARHDWETLRGCLAPDAVVHDHRMLSLGELGPDEWVESLRVRVDLAPDVKPEWFRILAWNRHGRVSVARAFGMLRDGGPFENVFVVVALVEGDRLQRFEIFDVADADRALARFEELCSDRP